uniref:LAGLIDADG endonuclease n=1 Tax=Gamarada debralockiae TaxID=2037899 RepID=A0A2U8LKQ2_9HELO|nr:LAGLIDADG endonuclease [Gamarada debralockiae]
MKKYKLNPYWVTGFVDAEGCFSLNMTENKSYKIGWRNQAFFKITLHIRDKNLLLQIKSFFILVGSIYTRSKEETVVYQVQSIKDIMKVIIPHFLNYPLITQKQSDFLIFKNIVKLMNNGKHIKKDGLIKIVNLKASLNRRLPKNIKSHFKKKKK